MQRMDDASHSQIVGHNWPRPKLIALRLGKPPAGYGHWTLRLLADQLVELKIVESVSPETVRQNSKKRNDQAKSNNR